MSINNDKFFEPPTSNEPNQKFYSEVSLSVTIGYVSCLTLDGDNVSAPSSFLNAGCVRGTRSMWEGTCSGEATERGSPRARNNEDMINIRGHMRINNTK